MGSFDPGKKANTGAGYFAASGDLLLSERGSLRFTTDYYATGLMYVANREATEC